MMSRETYPLALRPSPSGRLAPGRTLPLKLKDRTVEGRAIDDPSGQTGRLKLKSRPGPIRPLSEPAQRAWSLKLKGRAQNSPTSETLRHVIRRSRGPYIRTRHLGPLRNVTLHGFRHRFDQTLCAHPVGCRDVTDFGTALRP